MEAYERQQFDLFLGAAIGQFVERIEQRCGGPVPALERLRTAPEGDGVWLSDFVGTFYRDALVDNAAGACWILQNLQRRSLPDHWSSGEVRNVDELLQHVAREAFRDLLRAKAEETLEQRLVFQAE